MTSQKNNEYSTLHNILLCFRYDTIKTTKEENTYHKKITKGVHIMISFDDYRTINTHLNSNMEPEWFKSERYDYCESFFEKKPVVKVKAFFAYLLTLFI